MQSAGPDSDRRLLRPEHISVHILYSPDEAADFITAIGIRELTETSVNTITGILELFHLPVTALCEEDYEDTLYRDTYYAYFSRKFSPFAKNCKRVAFFQGELTMDAFCCYHESAERRLQDSFAGVCVIKPVRYGEIGFTVLPPGKLHLPECYLRTAQFAFHVLGHRLTVEGYPYTAQDAETMTCAEVTIWSIMEYFGTRFPDFQTVLPSRIIAELERLSDERVLPSRGSEYSWMSALFKTFGLAPRLYDRRAFRSDEEQMREFRKLFHYYVESGIPIAVGIAGKKRGEELRHSVVCIGHGGRRKSVCPAEVSYIGETKVYPCIDSAFLYEDYVMMDDNQTPYQVKPFGKLSGWSESEVSTFAVPLYRDVFLEAGDASAIINTVFADEAIGIVQMIPELEKRAGCERIDQNNPLILRAFLASASEYREFRACHEKEECAAVFYGALRLPRYVWVGELTTYSAYRNRQIYGEIVLDATAGRSSQMDSLILIRYLDHLGFRTPDADPVYSIDDGLKFRTRGLNFPYEMYGYNLTRYGGEEPR